MNNNINRRSRCIEDVVMWYANGGGPRVSKHVHDYTGFLPADWTLIYVPIR
jgi:hypothetical protein